MRSSSKTRRGDRGGSCDRNIVIRECGIRGRGGFVVSVGCTRSAIGERICVGVERWGCELRRRDVRWTVGGFAQRERVRRRPASFIINALAYSSNKLCILYQLETTFHSKHNKMRRYCCFFSRSLSRSFHFQCGTKTTEISSRVLTCLRFRSVFSYTIRSKSDTDHPPRRQP
jgi:hypothetical protein